MKKILFVLIMMLCCIGINAQRIAVLEFNAGVGVSQADVDGISAIFNTYFSPKGYTLVERIRIDRAIDEQNFQRSCITEDQMVRLGEILNVSYIVAGTVNIIYGEYNVDAVVMNVQSGIPYAKDGATWTSGTTYREMMKGLATRLSNKIAIKSQSTTSSSSVSQVNKINGHEYVDLGLSVKWATCNFGATSSEEYGAYMTYDKALEACKYWGGSWRLPTKNEMQELVDFCSWTATTQNGVNGCKVKGPNGNSIFLPVAGILNGSSLINDGEVGLYWSSTPYESNSDYAYLLGFDGSYQDMGSYNRYYGLSVRPVLE